jgi:hypothetical protein
MSSPKFMWEFNPFVRNEEVGPHGVIRGDGDSGCVNGLIHSGTNGFVTKASALWHACCVTV